MLETYILPQYVLDSLAGIGLPIEDLIVYINSGRGDEAIELLKRISEYDLKDVYTFNTIWSDYIGVNNLQNDLTTFIRRSFDGLVTNKDKIELLKMFSDEDKFEVKYKVVDRYLFIIPGAGFSNLILNSNKEYVNNINFNEWFIKNINDYLFKTINRDLLYTSSLFRRLVRLNMNKFIDKEK